MAQADGVVANGTGAAVRADLNDQLAAVFTNHSGSSEPATTYAYQWWADTTANVLKIRNSANNAWITLRELDGTMLIEDGSASTPGLSFASDTNSGLFGGSDTIGFATGGAERLEIGSSEVVFNDPSNDVDFRVESNGQTHMLFVEGGTDRVGIGESDPDQTLHISEAASGTTMGVIIHNTATANDSDARLTFNTSSGGAEKTRAYIQAAGNTSGDGNLIFATRKSGSTSESARIDSSGRLLLGTTTEGHPNLDDLTIATTGHTGITIRSGTSHDGQIGFSDGTSGDDEYRGQVLYNHSTNSMRFITDASERARIDSSGRLLVGTSTARANFYNASNSANILVEGLSSTTSTIAAVSNKINTDPNEEPTFVLGRSGTNSLGSTTIVANNNAVGRVSFQGTDGSDFVELAAIRGLVDGTPGSNDMPGRLIFSTTANGASSPTERLRINSSGDVGIGNSSPTNSTGYNTLTVGNGTSTGGQVHLKNASGDNFYIFHDSNGANIYNSSATSQIFYTNATERMRLGTTGTLCIGRTDSVVGTNKLSLQGDGTNTIVGVQTGTSTGTVNFAQFFASTTSCGGIAVNGTTGSTSYITTSDYRLKENIVDITGAIARLNNLAPKRFNFIHDTTQTTLDGFIAHEVQSVVPEAIVGDHNEVDDDNNPVYQGIDQSKLVPLLTAALQEAIAKIETLETKVAALEAG